MKEKIKIGLIAIHSENYFAVEDRILETQAERLEQSGAKNDFVIIKAPLVSSSEEARLQKELLLEENVDYLLILHAGFSMGDILECFEGWETPIGVWAVPETTETGDIHLHSMVSMNLYISIILKKWNPHPYVRWFYGNADSDWFQSRFSSTMKALRAVKCLRGGTVGMIGKAAAGFDNLIVSNKEYSSKTGITIQNFDAGILKTLAEHLTDEEIMSAMQLIKKNSGWCGVKEQDIRNGAAAYLALKKLAEMEKMDAAAVSCWPDFQNMFHIVPCVPFTLLGDLCGVPIACEGDLGAAVTMLAMKAVSGSNPVIMDVTAIKPEEESLLLWHCGIGTKSLMPDQDKVRMINHPMMNRKEEADRRMGLSYDYYFKNSRVTVSRMTGNAEGMIAFQGMVSGRGGGYDGTRGYVNEWNSRGRAYGVSDVLASLLDSGIEHHLVVTEGWHENAVFELCRMMGMEELRLKRYEDAQQGEIDGWNK